MSLCRLLLPAVALAGASLLALSGSGEAYALLGGSLDLGQRDFRVHDNFTDSEANDNTTPHPNFPGQVGAVRAIWAAVAEWGSERRRDGSGDWQQPFDIGSGGANFDSSFQGLADGPGETDDNIFSEISGNGLGVLAFTETPISDGWRIRFYRAPWVWDDGPGRTNAGPNQRDLQGVGAHEYGHALGLAHSTSNITNTMAPSAFTQSYLKRSLTADDIAGVQAIYGVRAADKPHIASFELAGDQLTIHGSHFAPTGNDVWFTRGSGVGDGTPVMVMGVPSSPVGTRIDVTVPTEAGSGDLLVRTPGDTGDRLSNAYPIDLVLGDCPLVEIYGNPKLNSSAGEAKLRYFGSPSATYDDFELRVDGGGIPGATGILFHGQTEAATPFMGGTLYSAGPFVRDRYFQFDAQGSMRLRVPVSAGMVGQTRHYQVWYADAGDAFGVGLSDALRATFCP